jgi:hypothetical protein
MKNNEFLFNGDLISGEESFKWLKNNLPNAKGIISLASCYVKEVAIRELFSEVNNKGRLLARWQPGDLIQGSSDLQVYEVMRSAGWDFYISENFHGKVYRLPGFGTMVGSANATLSGLSIYHPGNDEISTIVSNTDQNKQVVNELFDEAILVTPELYKKIYDFIVSVEKTDHLKVVSWPKSISDHFPKTKIKKLFVSDCFHSRCTSPPSEFDLSLLGINEIIGINEDVISEAIENTKMYKWLISKCKQGEQVKFGELTHELHNDLLDNPLPYRSTVKSLLSNLLSWVEKYKYKEIKVFTPRHTQIIERL